MNQEEVIRQESAQQSQLNIDRIPGGLAGRSIEELESLLSMLEQKNLAPMTQSRPKQTVPTVLDAYKRSQPAYTRLNSSHPLSIPIMVGSGILGLTIVVCTAIIASNTPNAQLTTQQHIIADLGKEALKTRPNLNIDCGWFNGNCGESIKGALEAGYGDTQSDIGGYKSSYATSEAVKDQPPGITSVQAPVMPAQEIIQPQTQHQATARDVIQANVNLRALPGDGADSPIKSVLTSGTAVEIYGNAVPDSRGFAWVAVRTADGLQGWITNQVF
jgi:hypothetical protein